MKPTAETMELYQRRRLCFCTWSLPCSWPAVLWEVLPPHEVSFLSPLSGLGEWLVSQVRSHLQSPRIRASFWAILCALRHAPILCQEIVDLIGPGFVALEVYTTWRTSFWKKQQHKIRYKEKHWLKMRKTLTHLKYF